MSTLDGVMLFPQPQRHTMHFESQRALMMREQMMPSQSKAFAARRGAQPLRAERRHCRPTDTGSLLSTERNRERIC